MKNQIRALWLWWSFSALLVLLLWALSFSQRAHSLLNARQLTMQANLRELASSFAALDSLPVVLLRTLQQQPQSLNQLQSQAQPFGRLYRSGHSPDIPDWILPLAQPRLDQAENGLLVLRPLPPGYETIALPAHLPDLYLVYCMPLTDGSMLIMNLDLHYLFQTWLPRHLDRFGLDGLHWRLLDQPAIPAAWRWTLPTLLADHPPDFKNLEIQLDNAPMEEQNLRIHLLGLLLAAIIMASFAVSIRLAARGIERELEFTEARGRFTAMVSHELRTPIATIKMYVDILRHNLQNEPDKVAHYQEILGRQVGRLQQMVENLLEAGALERGQRTFHIESVDLNAAVKEALSHHEEDPAVHLDLAPDLPPAQADRSALLQVLSNLIRNGHQYAREITIKTGPGPQIVISDRGPGIQDKNKIFETYQRRSHKQGFGLGLSVVRNFMEGQGGKVELDDNPGGGARFTLHFKS